MVLSLAPLKYRAVYAERGGPIGRVQVAEGRLFGGGPCYQASAFLRDDFRPKGLVRLALYGDEEGSGTDASRTVACYKAVSEAIERWAFYEAVEGPLAEKLGFEADPTTAGMAAFPGLGSGGARAVALSEAVERWGILEWWRGRLPSRARPAPVAGLRALEVLTPFHDRSIAILWTVGLGCSGAAYGFSGGVDFSRAADKALVELTRNQRVLDAFQGSGGGARTPESSLERRLLRFNGSAGLESFLARVSAAEAEPQPARSAPKPLVDAELRGPWTRYASVWRVLFEHEDGPDDRTQEGVFRF